MANPYFDHPRPLFWCAYYTTLEAWNACHIWLYENHRATWLAEPLWWLACGLERFVTEPTGSKPELVEVAHG